MMSGGSVARTVEVDAWVGIRASHTASEHEQISQMAAMVLNAPRPARAPRV